MHILLLLLGLVLLNGYDCHMIMCYPPPRGYAGNKLYPDVDVNLDASLSAALFCSGKLPGRPVLTVAAGDVVNVRFEGPARHGGGKCQFSLSYDGDKTFIAIGEYDKTCPNEKYAWPVKIPNTAPPCERCTFAWTWMNAVGQPQFYMNCADIRILAGPQSKSILAGPPMDVANLPGYPSKQPEGGDGPPGPERQFEI